MRFDGQPVLAQRVAGGQLGPEVHRHPGGAVRQRRDPVPGQAAHPDTARGTRHVLRAVAGHHRQPDRVQGVQPRVPHDVPVHGPHAAHRAELRLRRGRAPAVVAHRPAHVRPGEHPAVRPREPHETGPEAEAPAGPRAPTARQVAHLAAVLLRAHHQRRGGRPVPVPVAAEPRARAHAAAAGHRKRGIVDGSVRHGDAAAAAAAYGAPRSPADSTRFLSNHHFRRGTVGVGRTRII